MKRDYGIDLLKMVAMMMIVAHHILSGGVEAKLSETGVGIIFCKFSIASVIVRLIAL